MLIIGAEFLDHSMGCIFKGRMRYAILFLLSIVLMTIPAMDSLRFIYLLKRPDTRTIAKTWIERNIPEQATILSEGYIYTSPALVPQLKGDLKTLQEDLKLVTSLGEAGFPIKLEIKHANKDEKQKRYRIIKVRTLDLQSIRHCQADYMITNGYFDIPLAEKALFQDENRALKRKKFFLSWEKTTS